MTRWPESDAGLAGTPSAWQPQVPGERRGADVGGGKTGLGKPFALEPVLIAAHCDRGCESGAPKQALQRQLDRQ